MPRASGVFQTTQALMRLKSTRKLDTFEANYTLTPQVLGSGSCGQVRLAVQRQTKKEFAVKIINKQVYRSQKPNSDRYIVTEIDILRQVHHRNIVSLEAVYQTRENIYLVMELAQGGELYEHLFVHGSYTETDARHMVYQILQGVMYLHLQGIVHRDLKPENLLLREPHPQADIMITDFGLSRILPSRSNSLLYTACGTVEYLAPEVLQGKGYGKPVDLWSVGVIVYCLLCGYTPFWGDDPPSLLANVLSGHYEFDPEHWSHISDEAKNLITSLLQFDPDLRPTAAESLAHPWFRKPFYTAPVDLTQIVKTNLAAKRSMRRALTVISAVQAFNGTKSKRLSKLNDWYQRVTKYMTLPNLTLVEQPAKSVG
ncbi:hypothetical protein IWQ62_000319 [Dispira parvispora]|uniref:Protein kinase domain-containing protein n=1 Tax=Dispira parvispora TaxID=1520584 RepID=A0A9W8AV07_9FUNG|nr:hypothetical protein IWQ62_000319 [Dispira parvispora]